MIENGGEGRPDGPGTSIDDDNRWSLGWAVIFAGIASLALWFAVLAWILVPME